MGNLEKVKAGFGGAVLPSFSSIPPSPRAPTSPIRYSVSSTASQPYPEVSICGSEESSRGGGKGNGTSELRLFLKSLEGRRDLY